MGQVASIHISLHKQRVYLDTNVFIYFLEQNPAYFPAVEQIMCAAKAQHFHACTGEIAVAETMVIPYRKRDANTIAQVRAFFSRKNFLSILPHDARIFDLAARLRAGKNIKFIDAVHLATASSSACAFFITNDKAIHSGANVQVISLKTFLP